MQQLQYTGSIDRKSVKVVQEPPRPKNVTNSQCYNRNSAASWVSHDFNAAKWLLNSRNNISSMLHERKLFPREPTVYIPLNSVNILAELIECRYGIVQIATSAPVNLHGFMIP